MIKKGLNLFTPSAASIREHGVGGSCCSVCDFPLYVLCYPFCRYRNAEVKEFLEEEAVLPENKTEKNCGRCGATEQIGYGACLPIGWEFIEVGTDNYIDLCGKCSNEWDRLARDWLKSKRQEENKDAKR